MRRFLARSPRTDSRLAEIPLAGIPVSAVLAAALLLPILAAPPADAAPAAPAGDAAVARELTGVRLTLERLVALLETQLRQQDTLILLRRIELAERRIAPMEGRLADLKSQRRQAALERDNFVRMMEENREEAEDALREGDLEAEQQAKRMTEDLERVLRMQTQRIDDLDRQIQEMEIALAGSRDEIEVLDDVLRERLDDDR